ncbi:MAG: aminoacyl-tRNA hydrolase [Thermoflexales bacterium]|nr:aminoacyl-tRNA hydrolase [Thermoflexales bacterium]MCX7938512.1 aminoacyl-tRNA hydrolase [Thermoflexales bacterium]
MDDALRLIVGLGNPGREYANHRHNVGFMVLDALAAKHNLRFSKMMFKGLIAGGQIAERKVLLVKPMTFMNLSGECVGALVRFYKLPSQHVLVIYDDLDLLPGQLRLRGKGGAGGHNGMRSIIAQLGTEDFPRLRVGIGRPPGRMAPRDYVLQDFTPAERALLREALDRAAEAVRLWLVEGLDRAMNWVNAPTPQPPASSASVSL